MGIWKSGYPDDDAYAIQPVDPNVVYVTEISRKIELLNNFSLFNSVFN